MKKILISVLLITLLTLGMSLNVQAKTYTINVAQSFSVNHPFQKALNFFAERIKEETNGQVRVNVYGGGVLGGEIETLQQVMTGNLDAAVMGGIMLWQGMDPRASIEDLPFLFDNYDDARKAYDNEFGDYLKSEILEPTGVKVLNYWENGFRHFTNNTRPINKPEDLRGIKFRSAESPIRIEMFRSLGANAVPMAYPEIFTGLQQGTIDGQENPLSNIDASAFYEVQKYLSLSGHIYSAGVLIINPKVWDSYPQDIKDAIQKVADESRDYERQIIEEDDARLVEKMEKAGVKVNTVDKESFRNAVQPLWEDFREEYGDELLDLLQN